MRRKWPLFPVRRDTGELPTLISFRLAGDAGAAGAVFHQVADTATGGVTVVTSTGESS